MVVADRELVKRTLSGDLEGFGELHRRYYGRVVKVVTGIVKDRGQAEDTVQEAYVAALEELARLNDPSRFYPWVCRIAVDRAIEERRKVARRVRIGLEVEPGDSATASEPAASAPSILDGLLDEEQAARVREALDTLPEGQRAALVLRFFDGLAMRNVAEALGCEEVTARTQVSRGLRKLGAHLEAIGETR